MIELKCMSAEPGVSTLNLELTLVEVKARIF